MTAMAYCSKNTVMFRISGIGLPGRVTRPFFRSMARVRGPRKSARAANNSAATNHASSDSHPWCAPAPAATDPSRKTPQARSASATAAASAAAATAIPARSGRRAAEKPRSAYGPEYRMLVCIRGGPRRARIDADFFHHRYTYTKLQAEHRRLIRGQDKRPACEGRPISTDAPATELTRSHQALDALACWLCAPGACAPAPVTKQSGSVQLCGAQAWVSLIRVLFRPLSKLLAEADDEPKRMALIELLVTKAPGPNWRLNERVRAEQFRACQKPPIDGEPEVYVQHRHCQQ